MEIEAPLTALYYPHWDVSDPRFLCEALMFWDRLAVIAPDERHKPRGFHPDPDFAREIAALNERFVSPIPPSPAAKAEAHRRLEKFASNKAPPWCSPRQLLDAQRATIASAKFLPDTIEKLREQGWAERRDQDGRETDIISVAVADVCMAALAGACATPERPAITTNGGDFAASSNLLLADIDAHGGIDPNAVTDDRTGKNARPGDDLMVLLQPAVPKVKGEVTPERLRRLMALRDTKEIDDLRALYRKTAWTNVSRLKNVPIADARLQMDDFRERLRADRDQLERELKRANIDWIVSGSGVVATVVAAGAAVAGAVTGGAAAIAVAAVPSLLGVAAGFRARDQARQAVLARHWTSWLYEVDKL